LGSEGEQMAKGSSKSRNTDYRKPVAMGDQTIACGEGGEMHALV
jgi:hypothetical protein